MVPVKIEIVGIEEVNRMLTEAPTRVVVAGYAKALRAGIDVIDRELDIRTPVGHGELRAAKATEVVVDSDGLGGAAAVGFGKQSAKANWLEYGHRMVTHKPGRKEIGHVPAKPFIRPAFDSSGDRAIEAFTNSISETVKQEYGE